MTESDLTGVPPELGVLSWLDGSPHSLAGSVADVARFAARVRVEERQRIAGEVRSAAAEQAASFGPDAEPYFKGRLDGLEDAARIVAGSSAVLVATPEPDAGCERAYGQGVCACQRRADVDFSHTATGPVATPTEPGRCSRCGFTGTDCADDVCHGPVATTPPAGPKDLLTALQNSIDRARRPAEQDGQR